MAEQNGNTPEPRRVTMEFIGDQITVRVEPGVTYNQLLIGSNILMRNANAMLDTMLAAPSTHPIVRAAAIPSDLHRVK